MLEENKLLGFRARAFAYCSRFRQMPAIRVSAFRLYGLKRRAFSYANDALSKSNIISPRFPARTDSKAQSQKAKGRGVPNVFEKGRHDAAAGSRPSIAQSACVGPNGATSAVRCFEAKTARCKQTYPYVPMLLRSQSSDCLAARWSW